MEEKCTPAPGLKAPGLGSPWRGTPDGRPEAFEGTRRWLLFSQHVQKWQTAVCGPPEPYRIPHSDQSRLFQLSQELCCVFQPPTLDVTIYLPRRQPTSPTTTNPVPSTEDKQRGGRQGLK